MGDAVCVECGGRTREAYSHSHNDKMLKIENLHIFRMTFETLTLRSIYLFYAVLSDMCAKVYLIHCETFVVLETENSSRAANTTSTQNIYFELEK